MHSTIIASLVLLCLASTLAQSHDGKIKPNHHAFRRVKRGGSTIHLIGDETLARWSGGSVPGLPAPKIIVPLTTTSYTNLMDSINAGLGVPVGRSTAVSSSSSSSPSVASITPASVASTSSSSSSSSSSSKSSSSAKSTPASTSSKPTTSSKSAAASLKSAASTAKSAVTSKLPVILKAGRPAPSSAAAKPAKRTVAFNATVAEGVDEAHIQALGRRAVGNVTEIVQDDQSSEDVVATVAAATEAPSSASDASSSASDTSSSSSSSAPAPSSSTATTLSFSSSDLATSQGWGAAFANKYTSMMVNNHGVRGATARSIYRDMWSAILSSVNSGDSVLIQLGHYDGPMPGSSQDTAEGCIGAAPGSGSGSMTITSGCTGASEVVMTFAGYLTQMCKDVQAKGATCLIASVTPKNKFSGTSLYYNSPYTSQAKAAASAAGATYIPHLETITKTMNGNGAPVGQQSYWLSGNPMQPNIAGADLFAATFAAAASCAGVGGMTPGIAASGQAVQGAC